MEEVTEDKSLATSLLSDKPTLTLCDYIGETEKGRTERSERGRDGGETERKSKAHVEQSEAHVSARGIVILHVL